MRDPAEEPELREERNSREAIPPAAVRRSRRRGGLRHPSAPAHPARRSVLQRRRPRFLRRRVADGQGPPGRARAPGLGTARGADRFHALVRGGFYDGQAFFHVIRGFVAQFGLHGDTAVAEAWRERTIPDDTVGAENVRGTLTFARSGLDSRTTQLFFNLGDNRRLDTTDGFGFAPIGRVVEGLPVLDALNPEYSGPAGRELPDGPHQDSIWARGEAYLVEKFPNLDRIERARVVRSWD